MPTAWLQHRFALVLALYFLWLPAFPLSPSEAEPPAVESGVAGKPQTVSAFEEPLVLPGVVIEEIPKDSALEKAGLQVGDVILSWERLPSPPAMAPNWRTYRDARTCRASSVWRWRTGVSNC